MFKELLLNRSNSYIFYKKNYEDLKGIKSKVEKTSTENRELKKKFDYI